MPVALINIEFLRRSQLLFIDSEGELKIWGPASRRKRIMYLLDGRHEEMKAFLTNSTKGET